MQLTSANTLILSVVGWRIETWRVSLSYQDNKFFSIRLARAAVWYGTDWSVYFGWAEAVLMR